MVSSKADSLTYTVYFDTETTNSAEIKQGILDNYRTLIRGVHEESEAVLVAHISECGLENIIRPTFA